MKYSTVGCVFSSRSFCKDYERSQSILNLVIRLVESGNTGKHLAHRDGILVSPASHRAECDQERMG